MGKILIIFTNIWYCYQNEIHIFIYLPYYLQHPASRDHDGTTVSVEELHLEDEDHSTGIYVYSKTCLQWTLRRGDNLWSGDTFSESCPIFPMLKNLWWRDTCHVGTLSLGYRAVPWRQVLLYTVKAQTFTTWLMSTWS